MRSKAPLALIELTVMLLVLALAAGICLQAFHWADSRSLENRRKDEALLALQSAAEVLKHCGGDFEAAAQSHGGSWDGQCWRLQQDGLTLEAMPRQTGNALLGSALLRAVDEKGVLVQLSVCWQEVAHGE